MVGLQEDQIYAYVPQHSSHTSCFAVIERLALLRSYATCQGKIAWGDDTGGEWSKALFPALRRNIKRKRREKHSFEQLLKEVRVASRGKPRVHVLPCHGALQAGRNTEGKQVPLYTSLQHYDFYF